MGDGYRIWRTNELHRNQFTIYSELDDGENGELVMVKDGYIMFNDA